MRLAKLFATAEGEFWFKGLAYLDQCVNEQAIWLPSVDFDNAEVILQAQSSDQIIQ
jgi:hypothetical protein